MPENVRSAGYFMPYSARSLESKNREEVMFSCIPHQFL